MLPNIPGLKHTASNNFFIMAGPCAIEGDEIAFEIADVFGDENQVTEVGKSIVKDSTGKVTYTGKYMAIWEKRDGKYVCIRDIGNDDAKEK